MSSFSVSLPLETSDKYGFAQIEDFRILMKQNLKMLILTNPGERVMNPNFGVGLKRYLFELTDGNVIYNSENNTFLTKEGFLLEPSITERISNQMRTYLPYIIYIDTKLMVYEEKNLKIDILYSLPTINIDDTFSFISETGIIFNTSNQVNDSRVFNASSLRY